MSQVPAAPAKVLPGQVAAMILAAAGVFLAGSAMLVDALNGHVVPLDGGRYVNAWTGEFCADYGCAPPQRTLASSDRLPPY